MTITHLLDFFHYLPWALAALLVLGLMLWASYSGKGERK